MAIAISCLSLLFSGIIPLTASSAASRTSGGVQEVINIYKMPGLKVYQRCEGERLEMIQNMYNIGPYRDISHISIDEVNDLQSDRFVRIFGNIVEHFPAAAIAILKKRPFHDINEINQSVTDFLNSLKSHEKERILQLHPEIINELIYSNPLPLKTEIRGTSGLNVEEKTKLRELNSRYKEKFGFPFIFGDKEKDINTIFSEIVSRLQHNKEEEIECALTKVKNIVKLRIHEIVR